MSSSVDSRDGLEWAQAGFYVEARWTHEPSIEAVEEVCRDHLSLPPEVNCTTTFLAQGAFNKVYMVDIDKTHVFPSKVIMRVTLPVEPHHKSRGEVATLRWVRENTCIPVPYLMAFDDSNDNEIGFEWIMMEFMPGQPLIKYWEQMSAEEKRHIVEQMAGFQAELDKRSGDCGFRGIGTLTIGENNKIGVHVPAVGRLVQQHFFLDGRDEYDVPRGPFRNSHDWLKSYLELINMEHAKDITFSGNDEEDIAWHEDVMRATNKLLSLLPKIFPAITAPPERTYLFHHDLHFDNILVDDKFNITAILDWEAVSCNPSWVTTQFPRFLDGTDVDDSPIRDEYADEDQGSSLEPWDLFPDAQGKCRLYWERYHAHELTQLRRVYTARMEQLRPGWASEVEDSKLKLNFLLAATHAATGSIHLPGVEAWIDDVEDGRIGTLQEYLSPKPVPVTETEGEEV